MSRTLRRNYRPLYYARKLEGLRNGDPQTWWRSVEFITGQTVNTTQPMTGLANQLHDGDVHALADSTDCFQGVAADLNPLEQYVVTA